MAHSIRQAWKMGDGNPFTGPVETDTMHMGGKRKSKPKKVRAKLEGRGPVDMTAVTGIKDRRTNQVRAEVVPDTKRETMSPFIMEHTEPGAKVYTDDASAYDRLPNRESVNHSRLEYVRGDVHTNGVESFWSMLKRANVGTFHKISPEYFPPLRGRVRRTPQLPGTRYPGTDHPACPPHGRQASPL